MLTYTPGDRFFDELVTFLCSISSLWNGLDAQLHGNSKPYGPNDYITLEGTSNVSNLEFRFFPQKLMQIIAANSWPPDIELQDLALSKPSNTNLTWLNGITGIHGTMIMSAFIQYDANVRPLVESKYTTNTQNWPMVCNFGRVLRNCFSHGGVITFLNLNATAVNWRGLSYSPTDNGRQVLYQDLTPVEIILLMADIDSVI